MMPGGMDFGVRLGGALQTLHVYVRRALIEEVTQSIQAGDPKRLELLPSMADSDPLLERLMLGILDALRDEDPSALPYVDYLGRAMAARLVRGYSASSPPARAPFVLGRNSLRKAIDFMQANLQESIDLPAIAAVAGLSPSHFAHQFRTAIGVAPHQYLVRLRTERAKRLLSETDTPLAAVAFACGFANQEHLTRIFKRGYGTTPAAYRTARRS
jgi:AraC family transcriptional regulator